MGTKTSAQSGLWSLPATWVGGVVPVDGDTVIIPSGHTVEFNVNQSAFSTGINGITVNGTLKLSRTAGTYTLKMKAGALIAGAGLLDCGSASDVIPFAAKHTLTGGSAWAIDGGGGLTLSVFGTEPTIKSVLLSGAESAGSTRLEVGTNLTADIWTAGDEIRINNINKAAQSESRTIQAITSTYIDISSGLTNSKLAGSIVCLITRHLRFIGAGAGNTIAQNFTTEKLIIGGGDWQIAGGNIFASCTDVSISAGVFSGSQMLVFFPCEIYVTGGVFCGNSGFSFMADVKTFSGALYCGNSEGIPSGNSFEISNSSFYGNSSGVTSVYGLVVKDSLFVGNTYGINSCSLVSLVRCTFSKNGDEVYSSTYVTVSGGSWSGSGYSITFAESGVSRSRMLGGAG